MARTYAAVVLDDGAEQRRWKLVRFSSSSVELVRPLRPRGFYANFPTLEELEQDCRRLSTLSDAEVDQGFRLASEAKKFNEPITQSSSRQEFGNADIDAKESNVNGLRQLITPSLPHMDLLKDSRVCDWHVSADNGETIRITEVPYGGLSRGNSALQRNFFLRGVLVEEQQQRCIPIEGWKIGLTSDAGLAMFAKTTNQVWIELGKPEELYEQTIRSVQVYMQLFSMVVTDSEVTRLMLFQHLISKFNYWKVKPNVSDLDESLMLMKKFNLNCLFPLERRVYSVVMAEVRDSGDPDSENGGKPLTFQRSSRRMRVKLDLEEISGENIVKTSLRGDEGNFMGHHQTRTKPVTAMTSDDPNDSELLSQTRPDSDHMLLSSKLQNLKRRKATLQSVNDIPAVDKIQKRVTDGTGIGTFDVDSGAVKMPSTSSICSDDDSSIQSSENVVKDQITVAYDWNESRVNEILEKTQGLYKRKSQHEYNAEPFPTIRKLCNSTSMIFSAIDCMEKGGFLEDVQRLCSVETLRSFYLNEVALREFGVAQFLPSVHKQKEVAERINYYAHDGDTVVEICSQSVDYISLLKERLENMGKLCDYRRFRVDEYQRQDLKDYVNKEALPTGSKLLICLSLSLALRGEQTDKILDTAMELKPKLIVLIAPLFFRRLDERSTYNLIWSDDELLQSEVSWPWGALEVPINDLDKKKGVSPTVFLWSRTDWATKHRQIASRFGHLKKSVATTLRVQTSTS